MKRPISLFGVLALAATLAGPVPGNTQTFIAKKGDIVYGTLQQTLDSKTSHDGDRFALSEKDTLFHHSAALKGALIEGHVENVTRASPTHKATMNVILDDIKTGNGNTVPIRAAVESMSTFEPKTHKLRDAGIILGAAVFGHVAAKKMGKEHGGLAGAAAGIALVAALKGDIKVKSGTVVKLKITGDVVAGNHS
jgi:hypothetical protein